MSVDDLMRLPSIVFTGSTFLIGLIVFHTLERLAPIQQKGQHGPRRAGYFADLTAALVDGPVLSALSKMAALWVVTHLPQMHERLDQWPWAAQFGLFLLVNDFGRYWLHRWYHEVPWLWRLHRVHHSPIEMDALSTFRIHALEAVIKYGVIIVPFHVVGVAKSVLVLYTCIDVLKSFWHHANFRNYIGPLNYVLNSPELHWWHHVTEGRGMFSNYGSIFSVWDRLFGTFYWPRGQWPTEIGVKGIDFFPTTYVGMFASMRYDDDGALRAYGHPSEASTERHPEAAPQSSPGMLVGAGGPVSRGELEA